MNKTSKMKTKNPDGNFIARYFKFSDRQTTFKKEMLGGLITFLAMAYILAVQPGMMDTLNYKYPGSMPMGGVFLATVISSFVATMIMGLLANVPLSLAPGMGINAFFVFTVCIVLGIDPYDAMATVLVSGWLYFIIAITPARKYISKAVPKNLKIAIGAGIGFFLAFMGLQDAGIIQSDASMMTAKDGSHSVISATSVKLGDFANPVVIVAIVVIFLMFILHFMKVKAGIIISMILGIVLMAILYGAGVKGFSSAFKMKSYSEEFGGFSKIAGKGWTHLGSMFKNPLSYIAIFVFLYTDFFDTTGTLFVIGEASGINEREGDKWMTKANIADATGTVFGASVGASTVTSFVESTTGTAAGARTGFASVVTAFLFLASMALWPIMSPLMPVTNEFTHAGAVTTPTLKPITAPVLILVGSLMMMQLKEFNWKEMIDVPALFLTILITMLTYSISAGMAAGIIVFVILNSIAGLRQYIDIKRGKPMFTVGDEGEIITSDIKGKTGVETKTNYWKRLNIPLLIMFVLAMVYFGTTVLYMY
ncbi:NCS2 family permease [Mycoplasma todarodis]|uniref:NCS2 family permease n=1 Tax=Mycoplasma todarodis TaxID=1937191 RepID=UPI003B361216